MIHFRNAYEQGYGSGKRMPARRYAPVRLTDDGVPICTYCGKVVATYKAIDGRHCMCRRADRREGPASDG